VTRAQSEAKGAGGKEASEGAGPVYGAREVDKRALIVERIEPGYTEEAQRRKVEGVVILRAVLAATGEVADVEVSNGLPHGLTERAADAARRIKFIPASKDGRRVSQRVTLAYYFILQGASYYGDGSKRVYYKRGCLDYRVIPPKDFVIFGGRKEAEESGYKKAGCP
jgi:TonB family protein